MQRVNPNAKRFEFGMFWCPGLVRSVILIRADMSGLTPCRRQSKTLLTIDECRSKIARNSVGRQMTIKNSVSIDFWSLFYDRIDVFDCRLPGVGLLWIKAVWHSDGISVVVVVVVVVVVNKNTTYIIFLNKRPKMAPQSLPWICGSFVNELFEFMLDAQSNTF